MQWSVAVEAEGDRVLTQEEIVELADAVAPLRGIASGIGSTAYGAQLIVDAGSRDEAEAVARQAFSAAASTAGLPAWPITRVDAINEAEDEDRLA